MIEEADRDRDGVVNAEEFYRVMRKREDPLDDLDSDDDDFWAMYNLQVMSRLHQCVPDMATTTATTASTRVVYCCSQQLLYDRMCAASQGIDSAISACKCTRC